jgi:hypothetical protein
VTGLLALYNPGGPVAPLGAERGGVFLPAPEGQEGTTRRMVWTDLDHWHWENLTLAPGLHLLPFQAAAEIDQPLAARVTFGPEGVIGIAALGPLRDPGDALLALPSRRNLAVRFTGADGAFVAGPDDQLAPGQFLASGVLSDEQRHRQEVYRQLLDRRTGPRYPARPTFLTWAAPLDLGFALPAEARRTGAALAAIPLTTERPAPGTRVTIPGPFLPYQGVGRDGFSLLYDPKNNEWVAARRTAARTLLRFQIPPELLPLRVERATLEVDVNAPGRPLEVLAGEGATALATRHGPVGRLRFTIDRADVLQPDAEGGVYLGLAVGDPTGRPGATAPADEWQVNELQLELTGRVPED